MINGGVFSSGQAPPNCYVKSKAKGTSYIEFNTTEQRKLVCEADPLYDFLFSVAPHVEIVEGSPAKDD